MEKKKWKVRKPKEAKVSPKLKPKLIALVEEPPSYHLKNAHLKPEMLQINDEDDKERCDELTGQLIECFYDYLQAEQKVPQKRATRYAYIVDHYARDFLIPYGAYTVLDYEPGFIHTFLGNWYIRKNMSPELDYIYASLQALSAFYSITNKVFVFCAKN